MENSEIYDDETAAAIEEAGRNARAQQGRISTRRTADDPVSQTDENLLLPDELEKLWECEDVIRHGKQVFLQVAEALYTIQQKRLYREDYRTFAEYCRDKWDLTDRHARNMANAWGVAITLNADELPKNERQFREFSSVPEDRRYEVWELALVRADGIDNVCAHHIAEAREELLGTPSSGRPESQPSNHDAAGMDFPEEQRREEPQVEAVLVDRDPLNHALRLINKHGAAYCLELAEHIATLIAEKGLQ